ncbi:MAG: lysophospholipid acyltransferase family protein [Muribaculaceae bacterium]|nr:lysophospholipid acyltransferase family protein [Muribaculaceae bacterium]
MKIIYYTYFFLIAAPLLLLATVLTTFFTAVGSMLLGDRWWGYYPAHIWAKIFCWLSLVTVKVNGAEKISHNKNYIFIANHQGAYDIFAIYGYLNHNFRWMMKKSLERIPLVGYACKKAGHIYVASGNSGVRSTMTEAEAELNQGKSLCIFPEGSRTHTGEVGRFKRGAFILAQEFQLPLVPITIDGAFQVMPRSAKLPRWGRITLTIHDPLPAPATDATDLGDLMRKSRETIIKPLTNKI